MSFLATKCTKRIGFFSKLIFLWVFWTNVYWILNPFNFGYLLLISITNVKFRNESFSILIVKQTMRSWLILTLSLFLIIVSLDSCVPYLSLPPGGIGVSSLFLLFSSFLFFSFCFVFSFLSFFSSLFFYLPSFFPSSPFFIFGQSPILVEAQGPWPFWL